MITNPQAAALEALGKIEGYKAALKMLSERLETAPLWLPAAVLKKQCERAATMINAIARRFERKLVVTLVGPCGSGKSTLLNALAGVDDLSAVGHQRPTTGNLIVFGRNRTELEGLAEKFGRQLVETRSGAAPEHVLLVDTPDTDSAAQQKHLPVVRRAIGQSDVLICVFDAENPKRKDHIDFLAPLVQQFNGESLVVVLNKCDRLDETELRERIEPDFASYLQTAWPTTVDRVLCLCARRHLQNPAWDEGARPKHKFDQFAELKQLLFDTFNQAGYVVDRRVENARTLHDLVFAAAANQLARDRQPLMAAARQIETTEKNALMAAADALQTDAARQPVGIHALVYQKMAQRWLGPVGWMIGIWNRLLIFGTGMAALFRFGRPLRQVLDLVTARRQGQDSAAGGDASHKNLRADAVLRKYRLSVMQNWPDIAETLVKGHFADDVRRIEDALAAGTAVSEKLALLWVETLDAEIERVTRRLSGFFLQLLFNTPGIAVLGYSGWVTVKTFFDGRYLATDYFLHAFWAVAIVLLMSFFLLQACIRLTAGSERLGRRVFAKLKGQVDQLEDLPISPLKLQLEKVLGLAAAAG